MIKKNRKSLFTWCIRTLAVSLVPTLLLVSCAADDSSSTTADTTAPTVSSVVPGPGSAGVNVGTTITVVFSEPIDTKTVLTTSNNACSGSVQLSSDNFASCVAFSQIAFVAQDGNTKFIFDPANDLNNLGGVDYSLKLTTDIADVAGNKLASDFTSSFTVVAATIGETVAADAAAKLTNAGVDATEAKSVADAGTARVATDNLTGSDNATAVLSSFLKGAAVGVASVSADKRSAALETVQSSVTAQLGTFETKLNGRLARTDASKAAFEAALIALINAVMEVVHQTGVDPATAVGLVMAGTVSTLDEANTPANETASAVSALSDAVVKRVADVKANVEAGGGTLDLGTVVSNAVQSAVESVAKLTNVNAGDIMNAAGKAAVEAISELKKAVEATGGTVDVGALVGKVAEGTVKGTEKLTIEPDALTIAIDNAAKGLVESLAPLRNNIENDGGQFDASGVTDATTKITSSITAGVQSSTKLTAASINSLTDKIVATVKAEVAAQQTNLKLTDSEVAAASTAADTAKPPPLAVDGGTTDGTTTGGTTTDGTTTDGTTTGGTTTGGTTTGGTTTGGTTTGGTTTGGTTTADTTAPTVTLSISPVATSISAKTRLTGGTVVSSNSYSIINSKTPTLSITSNEAGTYSISSCGVSASNVSIAASTAVSVALSLSDMATTSNTCSVTVTDGSGNKQTATLYPNSATPTVSMFQVDATGPSANFYLQSYFADDIRNVVTNAAGTGTNDNTSTGNLNARISNLLDNNGVGVKGYFLSESSTAPAVTSSDWVLATELTKGSITSADATTRLLDNSDDNVTFTLSSTGSLGASRTVYLHMLDFAGNTASVSDSIFLMTDTDNVSNFDNFTIRDVGTTTDNASITNSQTVTLVLDAYDNKSGIAYVYASENNTGASAIVQSLLDNGTGYDNFSTYFKAVTVGSTSDNISTYSYTFDNSTSGTKTVYAWVADGGKNIFDGNGNSDNRSDSIYLDSVAPTIDNATIDGNATGDNQTATYGDNTTNATSGDAAYTDNRTVTINLGYTDNQSAVFQYYISENGTTGSTSQYVDNVSGAIVGALTGTDNATDFTGKNAPFVNTDNLTLTHDVWSELDNDTNDSANNSVFRVIDNGSDNGTSDNISYTFSSDGAKTLTISIKDAANNITTTTRSITVDRTPPVRTSNSLSLISSSSAALPTDSSGLPISNSLTLKAASSLINSLFTDATTVVSKLYITDDNSSLPTTSSSFSTDPTSTPTITVDNKTGGGVISSGDNFTVYVYAIDVMGNGDNATGEGYSAYASVVIGFDNSTPTLTDNISVTSTNTSTSSDNQTFYTRDTSVSFDNNTVLNSKLTDRDTALSFIATTNTSYTKDNISSLGSFAASLSNISLTANDNNTINVFAKDDAGNIALVDNITVISDTTIPVMDNITLTGNVQGGADNTTHTDNATLKITINGAADNQTTTNSGLAYYYATDNASKTVSEIRAGKVAYPANNSGTVTLNSTTPGTKTVYVYLMDNALNISDNKSDTITFVGDTTLPTVSSVKINNRRPAIDNATYTNSDNVTVEIVAQDNQSGVKDWYLAADNTTPTSSSTWTAFKTTSYTISGTKTNVSENVTWDLTNADGIKEVYAWVRNAQDNISAIGAKVMQGYDNITLDATAPTADNATPKLTGKIDLLDNSTYTDNLTVTLDNLTTWKFETDNATSSGMLNGEFYVTDNRTFTPILAADNVTWNVKWAGLTGGILDNLTFTFGSAWNDNGTLGNTSLGLKTIYVWAKDNASNVSGNHTAVSITFDNESPVLTSFYLRDTDNGTKATATRVDLDFTNSDNVSIPLDNLTIAGDNGTGIVGYYFTDNTSGAAAVPGVDNVTWLTDNSTLSIKFDNGTNQVKHILGYLKDAAGKISENVTRTIGFDNNSPVIDNMSWRGDLTFDNATRDNTTKRFAMTNAAKTSGNLTMEIQAHDNESLTNYTSGLTHFFFAHQINRTVGGTVTNLTGPLQATDDNISSLLNGTDKISNTAWIPIAGLTDGRDNQTGLTGIDNATFDNATHTITFTMLADKVALGLAFDSNGTRDCATIVGWFKDNASNISGNKTVEFNLDNSSIIYKNF